MESKGDFERSERRRIYEYVERHGAVAPEEVRRNVLVPRETHSKPSRSGTESEPTKPMPREEFEHHVSILERDGHLEERDGKLRVVLPLEEDAETVDLDDVEVTIRPARQEDVGGIVGVVESVASGATHAVARRLAQQIERDEALLRFNEDEDRIFFVATVADEPIGWLHVEAGRYPMMDHTAEMTLGVLDRYRGKGIGSRLVDRGLDWADERGYRKVYQNLPATNEGGISFLQDHGWEIEGRREGHYLDDGDLVDEVELAVWLDD